MKRSRSIIDYLVLAFSFSAIFYSALAYGFRRPMRYQYEYDLIYYIPLALGALALLAMVVARSITTYRISQLLRLVSFLVCLHFVSALDIHAFLLLGSVLVEVCMFESYPVNALIASILTTAAVSYRGYLFSRLGFPISEILPGQLPLAVMGYLVSIFGSRYSHLREVIIEVQKEKTGLENLAVNLTRANTEYQDYAIAADESGRSAERRRITRDIHDIVGYTLTNNIMLMETAIDMMQENPLGIPGVIETARSNAEEGLAGIRQALYDLRRQEESHPVGIRAIHRLVRVFEEATAIEVQCELGNVPMSFSPDVDSTLYHLIQEGLINSFRHGKAEKISLLLWRDDDILGIRLRDNGQGAGEIREGIGLKGMRERIDKLGGNLTVSGVTDGFLLEAAIPVNKAESDG